MVEPTGIIALCVTAIAVAKQIVTFILNYRDLRERFKTLRLSLIRVKRTASFIRNNWGDGRKFGTTRTAKIEGLLSLAVASEQNALRLLQKAKSRMRLAWMALFRPDGLQTLEQDLKTVERGLNPMVRAMRDKAKAANNVRQEKMTRNRRISYAVCGGIGLFTVVGAVTWPLGLGACGVTMAAKALYNTKYGSAEEENAPDKDDLVLGEYENVRCDWEQQEEWYKQSAAPWRHISGPAARYRSRPRISGHGRFRYLDEVPPPGIM